MAGLESFEREIRRMLWIFVAISICVSLMVGIRIMLPVKHNLNFLLWNLFLAWIPLIASYFILVLMRLRSFPLRKLFVVGLGGGWLLFLPNAPYLTTDLIHFSVQNWWTHSQRVVDSSHQSSLWYDLMLMTLLALLGMVIGFVSLFIIHLLVRQYTGAMLSWLFVCCIVALSGFGVYLGRFVRWNSWDLFSRPLDLFLEAFTHIHRDSVYFSMIFSVYILITYILYYALTNLRGWFEKIELSKK
jgi:uncharacterized membrane protein